MSKPFPDLKTDEEAEDWLQNADLTEYDLSDMKKVRFELAPKDATISLRLPAALLATLKTRAAEVNMPTQRFIRVLIEAQLGAGMGSGRVALARTGGVGGPTAAQSARSRLPDWTSHSVGGLTVRLRADTAYQYRVRCHEPRSRHGHTSLNRLYPLPLSSSSDIATGSSMTTWQHLPRDQRKMK